LIEILGNKPVKASVVAVPIQERIEGSRVNSEFIQRYMPGASFTRVHHHKSVLLANEVKYR
jgi:hypothetical protein